MSHVANKESSTTATAINTFTNPDDVPILTSIPMHADILVYTVVALSLRP